MKALTRGPAPSFRAICLAAGALVLAGTLSSCKGSLALDEDLCPRERAPSRHTILLLDASDPLTPKHRAELERLVKELQQPTSTSRMGDFYVSPGEALIVYKLASDWRNLKPTIRVCNPGDRPDEWTWWKGLWRGKAFALHNWSRFESRIKELYPDAAAPADEAMRSSPILEHLGVIVPRHAPSRRSLPAGDAGTVHVILFSDLLQHSDLLSHYGPYPKAEDLRNTPGLRELATDLTRVKVSLFRLERSQYARWQSKDHYYWWTHLVRAFNGEVQWQESI